MPHQGEFPWVQHLLTSPGPHFLAASGSLNNAPAAWRPVYEQSAGPYHWTLSLPDATPPIYPLTSPIDP